MLKEKCGKARNARKGKLNKLNKEVK